MGQDPPSVNGVMFRDHLESYYKQVMFASGTPLHRSVVRGDLDVVKLLMRKGAHPKIKDSQGDIDLQRAETHGHQVVIAYLEPLTMKTEWPEYQFTDWK